MTHQDLQTRVTALEREVLTLRLATWRLLQTTITLASIQTSPDNVENDEKLKQIEATMEWLLKLGTAEIGGTPNG